jgi:hypothetical protein
MFIHIFIIITISSKSSRICGGGGGGGSSSNKICFPSMCKHWKMQTWRIYILLNLLSAVTFIMEGHKSLWIILEGCSVTKFENPWQKMSVLNKTNNRFTECIHFLQILLFPEGTDLTAGSQQRSHQFATSHQLEHYYQVLHPKTTGFVFLVQRMRQSK